MNETAVQAILIRHVLLGKKHQACVPNSQRLLHWESDLLSVTKAGLVHDFEIKCSRADYLADFRNKKFRHQMLERRIPGKVPNYFWFVTTEFEIEPPEYAGWLLLEPRPENHYGYTHWVRYMKKAPRLHKKKWDDKQIAKIGHLLSYRVMTMLEKDVFHSKGSNND